jgi:hypothetical protein
MRVYTAQLSGFTKFAAHRPPASQGLSDPAIWLEPSRFNDLSVLIISMP